MRFGFKFSNLCGSVYSQGNLLFTPDGGSLLSPVGNRVTVFDLENSKSLTLPTENAKNIDCVALSPDGTVLITVDEEGRALLINFRRGSVLNYFNFKTRVSAILFSPCGKYFAVSHGKLVQVWMTPSLKREYAPFVLHRTYGGHFDEVVSLDWSTDSSYFISGSRDLTAKIFSLEPSPGFPVNFAGHKDTVIAAFLPKEEDTAYTVARDGCLVAWQKKEDVEDGGGGNRVGMKRHRTSGGWMLRERHFFHQGKVQCATIHKESSLLVVGFSSGIFGLYELPSCNNIHTLSISSQKINSVSINKSGEWLAFGSKKLGQLLVWEWQSETYVLKQQGHSQGMNCIDYSPNGSHMVSGGEDGKVKIWQCSTGFCFVTFTEHTGAVQSVKFLSKGNAVLSASLDGSVRAFDLVRYRNFRTMTTPKPTQFLSLAVDPSDEIVCAGTQDSFEIFVWSLKTGRLLEVLAGHEGPISCLSFNPIQPVLASSSWDKTVKLWDVFESKAATQTLQHNSDVLCVTYRPDGKELVSSALDGQIYIWNAIDANLLGTIEGRRDVMGGRKKSDRTKLASQASASSFSTLCYSADGKCLIAGGNTKWVCIYNISRKTCIKKFPISSNQSLDGILDQFNTRNMTEAGPLNEIDHDSEEEREDARGRKDETLPGAKRGQLTSSRKTAKAIRSTCLRFSPTGRAWAAATTEGLLIYSLDETSSFDPLDLDLDITPARIYKSLEDKEWLDAILMALRLNEASVLRSVYERVPKQDIPLLVSSIPAPYVKRMLDLVAVQASSSPHIEFHLQWAESLLLHHGAVVMQEFSTYSAPLRAMHMSFSRQMNDLSHMCNNNHYSLAFITSQAESDGQSL